ncbi:MAG TPA: hypothetical protein VLS47_00305, partial [Gallionella sp.]|nr:hypothetical protein [Gallionella sp.]
IAQIILLCSCGITSPAGRSGSLPPSGEPEQVRSDSTSKRGADKEFNEHHEITPTQSIEKEGLLISYSLLAIPDKESFLIRISLVFRNLQDRSRIVRPQISLQDASGKKISAYTKAGFIRFSSRLPGKVADKVTKSLIKKDSNGKGFAKSRIEWANTYWLKQTYKLPPQGIAIGELVYHCSQLNLPMKLTVSSNKQEFVFTTEGSFPIVDE